MVFTVPTTAYFQSCACTSYWVYVGTSENNTTATTASADEICPVCGCVRGDRHYDSIACGSVTDTDDSHRNTAKKTAPYVLPIFHRAENRVLNRTFRPIFRRITSPVARRHARENIGAINFKKTAKLKQRRITCKITKD